MRHQFPSPQTPIPEGKDRVEEACTICGCKSLRFLKGYRTYLSPSGGTGYRPSPCRRLGDISNGYDILKSNYGIIVSDPVVKGFTPKRDLSEIAPLTPKEAILKDAITIIQLLYKELLANRASSDRVVGIARRFLQSQGCLEVVKEIESKLS